MATAISATGQHSLGRMSFGPDEPAMLNASSFHSNEARNASPTSSKFPDQASSRLNSPSAALPDFVFPSRAPPNSAPPSFSRATGRRPTSAYELSSGLVERMGDDVDDRRTRHPAVPDFSFSHTTTSGLVSPPQSPQSPQSLYASISSRSSGHRRGTSELHGGDATTGLLSLSPSKATAPSSLGPSAGRKGHSHRRSAAISSHDLTFMLKPSNANAFKIGGSAPTSPSDYEHKVTPFPGIEDTVTPSTDIETGQLTDSSTATNPSESPREKMSNRNRVGFSDTLEYIPRPLSLISSDTSSTVRGHSVSGSLSSIVSAGASSPTPRDQRSLPSPIITTRPRTAGSILDGMRTPEESVSPRRRGSTPLALDLVPISPASPATPKWGFFGRSGESSPNRSRPVSAASSERVPQTVQACSAPASPDHIPQDVQAASVEPLTTTSRRASVSSRKSNKKQKKVKSWAGSILSRKSRPRSQKQKALSRRSPTPPLRPYAQMCEANAVLTNQANLSFVDGSNQPLRPEIQTDFASWKPRQVRSQDEESMSPIIDLDAALGPFNTPSGYDAEWDASQRGSGPTKRRMHSAGGMGGFMGPGMHYHRRAESAPEMVPFEARFGLHRLGSSSTMADVFEEDEEDDEWEDTKAPSDKGDNNKTEDEEDGDLGIDIKVVDAENMHANKPMDWTLEEGTSLQRGVKRKGSGLSEGDRRQVSSSMKSEHSSMSLKDEPILEEASSPTEDMPNASTPPRPDSRTHLSDSTATPPLRARQAKDLAPVDVQPALFSPAFLTPTSPNSTAPSPFPSPRSPFSYDAQRISTAPSSITDERGYESLLNGEPGPEYRMSVDEVPSLASSNSTMTRETVFNLLGNNSQSQFRDGQRSASLSSATVSRKRSSMASLSRLISSSHGEKSKLSIESRPASTMEVDKKGKESRSKRISRLMQFWKPKETA